MRRADLRSWLASTKVSGQARHVLMVLEYAHANDGRAWPSVPTLAAETGWSERTVQRALRELEETGDIATMVSVSGHATVYSLWITRGDRESPVTVSPKGVTDSPKGVTESHPEGSKKVLRRRAATSSNGSTPVDNRRNGARTDHRGTFLPGTGWVG
jgi:hypothetical protein